MIEDPTVTDKKFIEHLMRLTELDELDGKNRSIRVYIKQLQDAAYKSHKALRGHRADNPFVRFLMSQQGGQNYLGLDALSKLVNNNKDTKIYVKDDRSELESTINGKLGVREFTDYMQLFIPTAKGEFLMPSLLTDAVLRYLTVRNINSAATIVGIGTIPATSERNYGLPHDITADCKGQRTLSVEYMLNKDIPTYSLKIGDP